MPRENAPPFDGANTQCFLAQSFNSIYVLDGDASDPTAVHIFDAGAQSWSAQSVAAGSIDVDTVTAVLDHDSNSFCESLLFFL